MTDQHAERNAAPTISWDSTREEVLAAVEESERQLAAALRASEDAVFPGMPRDPARRSGCYSSADGNVIACYRGPTARDRREAEEAEVEAEQAAILLARQVTAGEEDQSAPGWDIGA